MATIIHDAAELVVGYSAADDQLETVHDGAVVIEDGTVTAAGRSTDLTAAYPPADCAVAIDASGQCVLPGFVDPHTHALFVGDRSDEYEAKLEGKSYQDILASGGGILRTVDAVRTATEAKLRDQLLTHLDRCLAHGTTTIEIKSGYGLSTTVERKMLRVIKQAADAHPIDVVPTFLGAHAVPADQDRQSYVDAVCAEQIPSVAQQGIATFCDVFCDQGAFTADHARRILETARDHGLTPKLHIDEFERLGGAEVAATTGAASADHLLQSTAADAERLIAAGVTPVLLPGTAFAIDAPYANPTLFSDRGSPPALATDFNPNCYSLNQQFTATLACSGMGMTPEAAVAGITQRAAAAVNRSGSIGRLEAGYAGDAVVIDRPAYRHLPYTFDVNLIHTVVKRGEPVVVPAQ